MNINQFMFIYDTTESKYSNLECYFIYDLTTNELVQDVKLNKTMIRIDRNNKIIYFMNFETEDHWILEKNYFMKIIQKFMDQADDYDCENYTICPDTSGGELYYKYN